MPHDILYDPNPKREDLDWLWQGISEHARQARQHAPGQVFAFFIKDSFDYIKAGCSGFMFYGSLYVDLLWVESSLRGQGLGRRLMAAVEELAQKHQCHFMAVNTMEWEALDFYLKLGFFVEFERQGFDKGSVMYFLRKDL